MDAKSWGPTRHDREKEKVNSSWRICNFRCKQTAPSPLTTVASFGPKDFSAGFQMSKKDARKLTRIGKRILSRKNKCVRISLCSLKDVHFAIGAFPQESCAQPTQRGGIPHSSTSDGRSRKTAGHRTDWCLDTQRCNRESYVLGPFDDNEGCDTPLCDPPGENESQWNTSLASRVRRMMLPVYWFVLNRDAETFIFLPRAVGEVEHKAAAATFPTARLAPKWSRPKINDDSIGAPFCVCVCATFFFLSLSSFFLSLFLSFFCVECGGIDYARSTPFGRNFLITSHSTTPLQSVLFVCFFFVVVVFVVVAQYISRCLCHTNHLVANNKKSLKMPRKYFERGRKSELCQGRSSVLQMDILAPERWTIGILPAPTCFES